MHRLVAMSGRRGRFEVVVASPQRLSRDLNQLARIVRRRTQSAGYLTVLFAGASENECVALRWREHAESEFDVAKPLAYEDPIV